MTEVERETDDCYDDEEDAEREKTEESQFCGEGASDFEEGGHGKDYEEDVGEYVEGAENYELAEGFRTGS